MRARFAGIAAAGLAACVLRAQPPTPLPAFDVASVKATPPSGDPTYTRAGSYGGPGTPQPTRWTCENFGLLQLITIAYDIDRAHVSGPSWLGDGGFDIDARIPAGATREQFHQMLQDLLIRRFNLAAHIEKKEQQILRLTAGKKGEKFKESVDRAAKARSASPNSTVDSGGYPIPAPGEGIRAAGRNGRVRLDATQVTMANLATNLTGSLGKVVVDETGLTGQYDLSLYWVELTGPEAPDGPTLIRAVEDQLGLALESGKAPVNVLVIDRVSRVPTEN